MHVVGNSVGGWVALELATSSAVPGPSPRWLRQALATVRAAAHPGRHAAGPPQYQVVRRLFPDAPRTRIGRALAASQVSGHPFRMPYEPARDAVHAMAAAPGFRETLRALEKDRFSGGGAITVPVTVAFGTRDRVLLPGVARRRDELPEQTRWVRLRGCGPRDGRRPSRHGRPAAGERPAPHPTSASPR